MTYKISFLNRHYIGKLFLLFFLALVACSPEKKPVAQNGILDLRNWDLANENISLVGQWEFFWQQFKNPADFPSTDAKINTKNNQQHFIKVSGAWNSFLQNGKKVGANGYATYHLQIFIPQEFIGKPLAFKLRHVLTAYRLYVDGELLMEVGTAGKTKITSVPAYNQPLVVFIPQLEKVDIVVQVSNFFYAKSGLLEPFLFGTEKNINFTKYMAIGFDLFLLGSLLIMSIYHFGLFILRTQEKSFLFFGLFTFLFVLRILTRGEMFVDTLFPAIPFSLQIRIEYLAFYIGIPIFYRFLYLIFPKQLSRNLGMALSLVSAVFSLIVLVTPVAFFTKTIVFFQLVTVIFIIWVFAGIIRATRKKERGSAIILFALIFFAFTAFNDMLYLNGIIDSIELTPLGLFVLVFAQSFMLSLRVTGTFAEVEKLSLHLEDVTAANSRFVPEMILSYLDRQSILDIQLGDNTQRTMAVMFCEIINFNEFSEKMTPEENFQFINSYLKMMGPLIREHQGFIDKYFGDGFMAIFPQGTKDIAEAAIKIQREVINYNESKNENEPLIKVGMGIHIGELMLGTIGEEERIDATVISDAVNISSRLKDLTKTFGSSVIVSQAIYSQLPKEYHCRKLGNVKVKGKSKSIFVYEILNYLKQEELEIKLKTQSLFELAVEAFSNKEVSKAKKLFTQVLQENPNDQTAKYYVKASEKSNALSLNNL